VTDGPPEQDLIQKAKAGDNMAYEDLLRPNLAPAARLAHTLLGSPTEAEDAVQEAAVKGPPGPNDPACPMVDVDPAARGAGPVRPGH